MYPAQCCWRSMPSSIILLLHTGHEKNCMLLPNFLFACLQSNPCTHSFIQQMSIECFPYAQWEAEGYRTNEDEVPALMGPAIWWLPLPSSSTSPSLLLGDYLWFYTPPTFLVTSASWKVIFILIILCSLLFLFQLGDLVSCRASDVSSLRAESLFGPRGSWT